MNDSRPETLRAWRRHGFNMIEIVLALGVIAVGVISILALFPIGLAASRDAMADSNGADIGDQMLHQMEYFIRSNWAAYVATNETVDYIKATKPSTQRFDGTVVPYTNGTLFQNAAPGTSDGRYRVIRYLDRSDPANTTYDPDTDVLDFEGILVVWKQQVTIPPGSTPIPYRTAVRINAELSWPAQLPYAQRQKSYFTKELFNRQ